MMIDYCQHLRACVTPPPFFASPPRPSRLGSLDASSGSGSDGEVDAEDASLMQLASNALLVGFTATPFRLDSKQLGDVFQVGLRRTSGCTRGHEL